MSDLRPFRAWSLEGLLDVEPAPPREPLTLDVDLPPLDVAAVLTGGLSGSIVASASVLVA